MRKPLKPCPFCGNKASISETEKGSPSVECDACPGQIYARFKDYAVEYWNRRPVEDALRAEVEELTRKNALLRAVAEAAEAMFGMGDNDIRHLELEYERVRDAAEKGGAL